jgi:hypothetical protein
MATDPSPAGPRARPGFFVFSVSWPVLSHCSVRPPRPAALLARPLAQRLFGRGSGGRRSWARLRSARFQGRPWGASAPPAAREAAPEPVRLWTDHPPDYGRSARIIQGRDPYHLTDWQCSYAVHTAGGSCPQAHEGGAVCRRHAGRRRRSALRPSPDPPDAPLQFRLLLWNWLR